MPNKARCELELELAELVRVNICKTKFLLKKDMDNAMRRVLASLLLLLLPALAVAQPSALPAYVPASSLGFAADGSTEGHQGDWVLPVWRSADGRWLALAVTGSPLATTPLSQDAITGITRTPIPGVGLELVDATSVLSTGVRWSVAPNVFLRAKVNQRVDAAHIACGADGVRGLDTACAETPVWLGGEVGGSYHAGAFSFDLGASWLDHAGASAASARIAPHAFVAPGLLGLPLEWVDSMGGVSTRGSMRIGESDTSVSVGASMARLNLFPGGGLGLDAIDQKAVSLGVGTGPISGLIVGRVMEPMHGIKSPLSGPDQQWSAIDLGITLSLPWNGELSVGAQNVWSSGAAPLPSAPTDPAQRRVPYIQYHQEL